MELNTNKYIKLWYIILIDQLFHITIKLHNIRLLNITILSISVQWCNEDSPISNVESPMAPNIYDFAKLRPGRSGLWQWSELQIGVYLSIVDPLISPMLRCVAISRIGLDNLQIYPKHAIKIKIIIVKAWVSIKWISIPLSFFSG